MPVIGKPDPNPFPMVITSGVTPLRSQANQRPVLPNPVIISSEMKMAPNSFAMSWARCRNSGGGMTFPAVPCMGSTMTAAT